MIKPDKWVILHVNDQQPFFKILSAFYGGYLGSDSWRLSSPIVKIEYNNGENKFLITTDNGTAYELCQECYGFASVSNDIYENIKKDADDNNILFNVIENPNDIIGRFNESA